MSTCKNGHGNIRCVICNAVSSGEISSREYGVDDVGISYRTFVEVPYGKTGAPAFICYDCRSSVHDALSEFDLDEGKSLWAEDHL